MNGNTKIRLKNFKKRKYKKKKTEEIKKDHKKIKLVSIIKEETSLDLKVAKLNTILSIIYI